MVSRLDYNVSDTGLSLIPSPVTADMATSNSALGDYSTSLGTVASSAVLA